jgi:hypothetical protein
MKNLILTTALTAFLFPSLALAEGKANENWAEKAAIGYEKKAAMAAEKGDAESAAIYQRMAQIKRAAGAHKGEKFDWSEYHELNGKLNKKHAKHDKHAKHSEAKEKDGKDWKHKKHIEKDSKGKVNKEADHDQKAHKNPVKQAPGEGFLQTSREFQQRSIEAIKAGDTAKAEIYLELAEIKAKAATAVEKGEEINWDRYHELQKQLHK